MKTRNLLVLAAAIGLSGMGCDDGGPSTTFVAAKQNPPAHAPAPSASPTPAASPAPGAVAAPGPQAGTPVQGPAQGQEPIQDQDEQRMLALINQHRAENGAAPLKIDPRLIQSSRWLSQDMAARSYLSHTDSLGRDSFQRMDLFGFELKASGGSRGENIACGNGDADRTYLQWLYSPGHDANMLNPRYTDIGIARAYDADSRFGWYWTTDFGSGN
jgi:uncharacterized protein YkwD